jgi:hypothetical protein
VLYHLSHTSSPFRCSYIGGGVLWTICVGLPLNQYLPNLKTCFARIICVYMWHGFKFFLTDSWYVLWVALLSRSSCFSLPSCCSVPMPSFSWIYIVWHLFTNYLCFSKSIGADLEVLGIL